MTDPNEIFILFFISPFRAPRVLGVFATAALAANAIEYHKKSGHPFSLRSSQFRITQMRMGQIHSEGIEIGLESDVIWPGVRCGVK